MHDYLCSVSLGLLYIFVVISSGVLFLLFSVLAKRLAGKSISEMIYFVSNGMLNLNSTRMWANAQPRGRPAEHRWRPQFNATKFG